MPTPPPPPSLQLSNIHTSNPIDYTPFTGAACCNKNQGKAPSKKSGGKLNRRLPSCKKTQDSKGARLYLKLAPSSNSTPATPISPSRFEISKNTILFNGLGEPRGTVRAAHVKINWGQLKYMFADGKPNLYAYVWDTQFRELDLHGSGWILLQQIKEPDVKGLAIKTFQCMAPILLARKSACGAGPSAATHKIHDWNDADLKLHFKLKRTWKFRGATGEGNRQVKDYLPRPSGVGTKHANMCFNLPGKGGQSCDTFPVGTNFYYCRRSARIVLKNKQPMEFLFGFILYPQDNATRTTKRFGWIAKAALKLAS